MNLSGCSAALLKELLNKVIVTGLLYTTAQSNGKADICKIIFEYFVVVNFVQKSNLASVTAPNTFMLTDFRELEPLTFVMAPLQPVN